MESPIFKKAWNKRLIPVNIVYPNKYYGGSYCLAPLIIYNIINQQKDFTCERVFLDKGKINSNFIGFTFQYEPDYLNLFKILKQNNIPIDKNRKQIIFAGGPCINTNPEPLKDYIDFFILGEAEEILPKLLNIYKNNQEKAIFLNKISKIKGVYIPNKNKPTVATIKDLDKVPYPLIQPFPEKITKEFVFGKVFLLEIERGCPFRCHFCSLSALHKQVKLRSLNKIKEIINQGIRVNKRKKVVIYSPSFTHPQRKEILRYLIDKKLEFSVPSLKAETLDEEILRLIKKGKQKTITLAPEANESMRYSLNKKVPDKVFLDVIALAKKLGLKVKLYFMVGLPNQTTNDLDELIKFIKKADCSISINPFVSKPKTFFENHPFNKELIKQQMSYLRKRLKLDFLIPKNINLSALEYKLSHSKELKIKEKDAVRPNLT